MFGNFGRRILVCLIKDVLDFSGCEVQYLDDRDVSIASLEYKLKTKQCLMRNETICSMHNCHLY